MRRFNLLQLASPLDRRRIAHYLNRRHRLHYPGIHRLFFKSVVRSGYVMSCYVTSRLIP